MGKATRFAVLGIRLALLASAASLAHAEPSSPSDITISPDLGYIVETHPATNPSAPLIIHIQEAHTNYDAQKHLAEILDSLVKQHQLKLILVEGGEGDVSLSYLRTYGPPENRKQVAEKYLKLGILSGEEYLDIVSDYPLIIWGVEQKALHEQNVEVFMDTEPLRAALRPVLASVRQAVEQLRPRLLDPALVALETDAAAFEAEQLSLADYAKRLSVLAREYSIQESASPHVVRLVEMHELEQAMDLELIQRQQKEVLSRLRDKDPQAVERLMQAAQDANNHEGQGSREAFYVELERVAAASGLPLEQFPSLSNYVRYLQQSALLKPVALSDELQQLTTRLRRTLAVTLAAQQLQTVAEQVDVIEKLLELKLSPEEYQRLTSLQVEGLSSRWAEFLGSQLAQHGLPSPSFERLSWLDTALPSLQRFYTVAQARDESLIERALAKLDETREPLAVLITGGFHSPRMTEQLRARGLGLVVVTPKVTQPTNERLYQAVLKYKSGHGSFEEVETAASTSDVLVSSAMGRTTQGKVRQ